MIRVLQFADLINRHDFIDVIVQRADRRRFRASVCVREPRSNIAAPVFPADVPYEVLAGVSRWHIPRTAWALARLMRRQRIDILHAHHYDQAVIGWLSTRLYPRARLVVGRHYSDAIYLLSSGLRQRALLAIEGCVNRAAARLVVPSTMIRDLLVRQGVDGAKVDVIPYGFVPEKYVEAAADPAGTRARLGLGPAFWFGTFARLHREKGHGVLLEAVARLRRTRSDFGLLIVGAGPEQDRVAAAVASLGLADTVRLLGWRRDGIAIMAAVDAVVQPTLQEAFSQVMAEAMWLGKPLITTDVSGATDVITDDDNGLLVKRGDAAGLAAAMGRVLDSAALRERLGRAGRAFVEARLTVDRIMPLYEQSYRKTMGLDEDAAPVAWN